MTKDEWTSDSPDKGARRPSMSGGGGSPVYALGMVGALVYYWRRVDNGPDRLRAVGKALVWPAFVVHDVLVHLEH
jgi:hypothetical protein